MRSGTNIAQVTMLENYDVKVHANIGGWKHGFYRNDSNKPEHDILICVKNPYAWLVSFHRYFEGRRTSFADFTKSPQVLVSPFRDLTAEFRNPVCLWNTMNRHWLDIRLHNRKTFVIRHEDVVAAPDTVFPRIAADLGLKQISQQFAVPPNSADAYNDDYQIGSLNARPPFKRNDYLNRVYLTRFTKDVLDFVNHNLDHALMDQLQYPLHHAANTISTSSISSAVQAS